MRPSEYDIERARAESHAHDMRVQVSPQVQVWPHELSRRGGAFLGAARSWMQTRFRNGEHVTWGSNDLLEGAPITVADIEDVAAHVAAAAINEHNKRLGLTR